MNGAYGAKPGGAFGVAKKMRLSGVATAFLAAVAFGIAAAQPVSPTVSERPHAAAPEVDYRMQGARHLYASHGHRIFKGLLPPLLYAIAIVETEIDEDGKVVDVVITREPASAKEVMPWIVGMIRGASPFPKPLLPGRTRYKDIWLVDRSYMFQLDTLTEGQRWGE